MKLRRQFCWMLGAFYISVRVVYSLPALPIYNIWGDANSTANFIKTERDPKVLNFISLPEDIECSASDGRRKGICLNKYECRIQGGKSFGTCAFGFGVCCVFTASCDKEVFNNITYFVNPDFPSLSHGMTQCTIKVRKIDPEVSQFRLDFLHFHLGQPDRRTGVCTDDVFVMSGGNVRELQMCGLNNGQHVYLDVENVDEPINIVMNLTKKDVGRLWEVRVTQIPFNQRVPNGCLQYHTGQSGILQTMNFADNGRHLANQDYTICIRQELGMCSIAYEPCDENSFKIGSGAGGSSAGGFPVASAPVPAPVSPVSSAGAVGGSQPAQEVGAVDDFGSGDGFVEARMCTDRIIMPCDTEDFISPDSSGPAMCDLVHCGTSFCADGASTCRVESSIIPFTIGVEFGPAARDGSPDDNLGMCLRYEQLPCV